MIETIATTCHHSGCQHRLQRCARSGKILVQQWTMQDGQIRFINVFLASSEAWYTFERPERKLWFPELPLFRATLWLEFGSISISQKRLWHRARNRRSKSSDVTRKKIDYECRDFTRTQAEVLMSWWWGIKCQAGRVWSRASTALLLVYLLQRKAAYTALSLLCCKSLACYYRYRGHLLTLCVLLLSLYGDINAQRSLQHKAQHI